MPVLLKTYCTSSVTVTPRGADCAVACTVILYIPAGVPVIPPLDPLPLLQPSRTAATLSASAIAHATGTRRFGSFETRRRSRQTCKPNHRVLLFPRFSTPST